MCAAGPTKDHDVALVYTRAGLPVEITAEFDNWRRIRDWEGAEGWVYHSLLSGRRTAVVTAKDKKELVPLYEQGRPRRLRGGAAAGRRARLGQALHRDLVPHRRRRASTAGSSRSGSVGRLPEREGRVARAT